MSDNKPMTITEFLEARIAEDEAAAKAWSATLTDDLPIPAALLGGIVNPSKSLAECAAKRAIILGHRRVADLYEDAFGDTCTACFSSGPDAQAFPCATVRALAAVYADHADYRDEWEL